MKAPVDHLLDDLMRAVAIEWLILLPILLVVVAWKVLS